MQCNAMQCNAYICMCMIGICKYMPTCSTFASLKRCEFISNLYYHTFVLAGFWRGCNS